MNYYNFVNTILDTAKSHKLVYEVGEGDIYEHLNSGDHKYPCVFLTVQNIDYNGSQMTVTGSLFYVDALLSDTSNKLQIQSTGMTTLQQIFMRLMDNYPDFELRTGRYTPFDEKFADLCAGVFSNFTVSFMDDICIVNDDIFEGDEPITPEPEGKYLTIRVDDAAGETIIHPNITGNLPNLNLQYRINNGKWTDFIVGTTAYIHLLAGDFVQWKGSNPEGVSIDLNNYLNFDIQNEVHLSGNVMSLIDGVGDTKVIPRSYCFNYLFKNTKIKTIAEDLLPATELAERCYYQMFIGCTSLKNAPVLPATTLADSCYDGMFFGCTSLTTAPVLPATTLTTSCYYRMFQGCTALVNAPALPATTLADSCYGNMFTGCTLLKNAPVLPATTLADNCYSSMFYGCTSLVTAPELPATTLSERCYTYMFFGCTSLVTAPELPATTLADSCYYSMFYNCNNMNYVKCLATDITATDALTDWLNGVAPTGTFVKKYGVEYLINSPDGIPEGWTVEEIDAPITEPKYLTITVDEGEEGITIAPRVTGTLPNLNLQYRINNGDWNDFIVGTTEDIHVGAGDFVQWKGNNPSGLSDSSNYLRFAISNNTVYLSGNTVHLSGNVMSLIDGIGETKVIPNDYCFYKLFRESNIKTVSEDFLPATEITKGCYQSIFYNCTHLVDAPIILPAEVLKERCYSGMYSYCTNLVTVQDILPSKTLAKSCYFGMYGDCYSLITPPQLPAEEMCEQCYQEMFYRCYKLEQAPVLNAKQLASSCYSIMFYQCSSLQYPPELPSEVVFNSCYYRMFDGCTSLVQCPELPAKVMNFDCYREMFRYCTSIKTAPILHSTSLYRGCYESMFEGCENLTQSPELPAEVLKEYCYAFMFKNCTSLENAPILPSTSLVDNCYANMFIGCSKLNYVKSLATEGILNEDGTATSALTGWLSGVASSGTFVKPAGVSYPSGSSGIPQGWAIEEIQ